MHRRGQRAMGIGLDLYRLFYRHSCGTGDGLDIRGSKFIGSIPLARRSALVRIAIDGTNDAS